MRVGAMIRIGPQAGPGLLDHIAEFGRQAEARGFAGVWTIDTLGSDRPSLDALQLLTALAAVTRRIALGTGVLQLAARNPVELAHRVQTLHAMAGPRLVLGVGSGSTRSDFALVGADYDNRFRAFRQHLAAMRRAWQGETVNGGSLVGWPGCRGGPPIVIGAWRNPRWIAYAATDAQGWASSGRYSDWDDLERGMRIYRAAGGTNAILANCTIDLEQRPETAELAKLAPINFICPPREARRRIRRVAALGVAEILVGSPFGALDQIERLREGLPAP
jgi:alkanesulfonate monooxygenase SsuD/methylene tetrahydromethanopterin reductase-like flavin-dependent oxidoreductase (luciferase family)